MINVKRLLPLALSVLLMFLAADALAQSEPDGRILSVRGFVTVTEASGDVRRLKRGDSVSSNDLIETSARSRAVIRFSDGGRYTLRANTSFKIDSYAFSGTDDNTAKARFSIIKGTLQAVSGLIGKKNRQNFRFNTPISTIGLRGTTFQVEVIRNNNGDIEVRVATLEGAIVYSSVTTGSGDSVPLPEGVDAAADISVISAEVDESTGDVESLELTAGNALSHEEVIAIVDTLNTLFTPEPTTDEEEPADEPTGEDDPEGGATDPIPVDTTPDGGSPL